MLNKQGDNIEPWCTPFPIWNQSVVPCPVLTVASWPPYRFLRRQVRWSGIPISLKFSVICCDPHSQRFWYSQWSRYRYFSGILLIFPWSSRSCHLISGSSAFSKARLHIWKFSVHVVLKPSLKDFEHYFDSMWNEHNCMVVWTFLGIALLWDWNENWLFPVLWPLLSIPNLLTYWVKHFMSAIF